MASRDTPGLLPVLRTESQAQILTAILADPDREWNITQLADELEIPAMTVSREIRLAEDAGLVAARKVGTAKMVSANRASPYFEPLSRLLLIAFGPVRVLGEAVADLDGVEEAFIFGSWAERYRGHPGPPPADIDLLVVGDVDRASVYEAVESAESRLRREIQVTFRSAEQWQDETDPFIATVRGRALVPLVTQQHAEVSG